MGLFGISPKEHETAIEEAKADSKYEVTRLERQLEEANETITRKNKEARLASEKHNDDLEAEKRKVARAQSERDSYKENVHDQRELDKNRIILENRETIMGAKEESLKANEAEHVAKLKKLEVKAEEAEKRGYKTGYSDGLRKVHEITAEDRQNTAKIAMIAAASHNNKAAEKLVDKMTNGVAAGLPSGDSDK